MQTLEPTTIGVVPPRGDGRFNSWKFWLIALLAHLLFFALCAQIYVLIIKPEKESLEGQNFGDTVAVAVPQAPPAAIQPVQQQPQDVPVQPQFDAQAPQVLMGIEPSMPAPMAMAQIPVFQPPNALPAAMANIPAAWRGRVADGAGKRKIIQNAGGDEKIEDAVLKALRWLKENQNENGSWGKANPVAMTGMALLAYLAHGDTPTSREFGATVLRGINWLADQAEKGNGRMGRNFEYETGIGTYALAEAYGMTQMQRLKPIVESCVDTIINGQSKGGGWYYSYQSKDRPYGDISISGWQIQALKTAYLANVRTKEIPPALDKAMEYIRNVYSPQLQEFGYQSPGGGWQRTGIGVLCLQFWKEGQSDVAKQAISHIRNDIGFFIGKTPDELQDMRQNGLKGGDKSLYGYYYMTQAMFLADAPHGQNWLHWNKQFSKSLVSTQNGDGSFPIGDWANDPVYNTSLSVLMLTVYYRNNPGALNSLKR